MPAQAAWVVGRRQAKEVAGLPLLSRRTSAPAARADAFRCRICESRFNKAVKKGLGKDAVVERIRIRDPIGMLRARAEIRMGRLMPLPRATRAAIDRRGTGRDQTRVEKRAGSTGGFGSLPAIAAA